METGIRNKITTVSVAIIVRNAEATIAKCLDHLTDFEDIVLLDNGSTDKTLEVAKEYPNVNIQYSEFIGFGPLKRLASSYAKNNWILSIDSDEYPSKELLDEIRNLNLKENEAGKIHRLNSYKGKIVNACNWNNDKIVRLYNKKNTNFTDAQVHETIDTSNTKVVSLKGKLYHDAFENASELISKLQYYSDLYADQHYRRKNSGPLMIVLKTVHSFIDNYLIKRGFLYGWRGLLISTSNAMGVFYKYFKLFEKNKTVSNSLIITTYNSPSYLKLVLDSIERQSVQPDEVIIADDGSTSETKNLVDSYKNKWETPLKHVWQEDNGFQAGTIRNKGIAASKGNLIILIDGDLVLGKTFVESYLRKVKKGFFYQASRVQINQESTEKYISHSPKEGFSVFTKGITNHFNAISSSFLSSIFSKQKKNDAGTKSCNMAIWREDIEKVNGFNEDFVGWGREDSEFVVRLLNAGIRRINFRFGAVGFHLYHNERSRDSLSKNDGLLQQAIDNKLSFCENGINKYYK